MEVEHQGGSQTPFQNEELSEGFLEGDLGVRSKTSLRIHYEAQVHVIQKQIGGLEELRLKLGLSQRKISQLLMVDPSSWTRWTRQGDEAPPHIWRALQWYMTLQEKIPGLTPQYFIGANPQILHQKALSELADERQERLKEQNRLQDQFETLSEQRMSLERDLIRMKKDLKFHRKISIFFLLLSLCWGTLLLMGK